MSGFDSAKVDEEFFPVPADLEAAATDVMPTGRIKSNFLCNLGYGDPAGVYPRSPGLEFDEACQLL
jgi:3-hydroxypropanoate dehydrogenase